MLETLYMIMKLVIKAKLITKRKKELEVAAGEMHGYFASASKVHKHGKGRS